MLTRTPDDESHCCAEIDGRKDGDMDQYRQCTNSGPETHLRQATSESSTDEHRAYLLEQWRFNVRLCSGSSDKAAEDGEVAPDAMNTAPLEPKDEKPFDILDFAVYDELHDISILRSACMPLSRTMGTSAVNGEDPKRCWWRANGGISSLREMGLDTMHDTMEGMCEAWDWREACAIGDAGDSEERRVAAKL
ncbi:unnamed protein product [Peniophora sp. CBMAI 1063]|nr:unnamed protein product [Peniophora sp. CBMAI 1063]